MSRKRTPRADVMIENCTFTGGTTPAFDTLARAIEANAKAITELCKHVSRPQNLIFVGKKEDA